MDFQTEPGMRPEKKIKVMVGQIWIDPESRRVMVHRSSKGWVTVINEHGTLESYVISKGRMGQYFRNFNFHKNYEVKDDFPIIFKGT